MRIAPALLALAWVLAGGVRASAAPGRFFLHSFHAQQLGELECGICHVPVKPGSVILQRPGHEQCRVCHQPDFAAAKNGLFCTQCHSSAHPTGAADLLPFPERSGTRAVLADFSHALHLDPKMRIDPATHFRADCTFCHHFPDPGALAVFPTHTECAACHAKPQMKPRLAPEAQDCRGCHNPEEVENPGSTGDRRSLQPMVVTGRYENIEFSHRLHFVARRSPDFTCTTCHSAVTRSTSLTTLTLPSMAVCAGCHNTSGTCDSCHKDAEGRDVKPLTHTGAFRLNHSGEAATAGAACFACHQNVSPSAETKQQCLGCHQVMKPLSHTARWKDALHGQYAALDRTTCATCHQTEFCSRCHNELPRSHAPLPLFKNGGHARLAMLNQRACLTCHTFAATCSTCHTRTLR